MFKLMHKKLNKKGFTLAELLIVVAVIAILVAIAIPVFSQAMKKAQIRTNDANIRSTKAAAISQILDEWDTFKVGGEKTGSVGDEYIPGWFAVGHVTPDGKLSEVNVYIAASKVDTSTENAAGPAVGHVNDATITAACSSMNPVSSTHKATFPTLSGAGSAETWVVKAADEELYSTISPTGTDNGYYTLVYIDNVEDKTK